MKTVSVLRQTFRGDARARMQELREHVDFLLKNRGMQDLLTAMIEELERRSHDERYMRQLIADLKMTLKNYMARYDDEVAS